MRALAFLLRRLLQQFQTQNNSGRHTKAQHHCENRAKVQSVEDEELVPKDKAHTFRKAHYTTEALSALISADLGKQSTRKSLPKEQQF
jgi:hypothetical protein